VFGLEPTLIEEVKGKADGVAGDLGDAFMGGEPASEDTEGRGLCTVGILSNFSLSCTITVA